MENKKQTEKEINASSIVVNNFNSVIEFMKIQAFISQFKSIEKSIVTILCVHLFNLDKESASSEHTFTYGYLETILKEIKEKSLSLFNVIHEEDEKKEFKARFIMSMARLLTNITIKVEKAVTNKRELLHYHVFFVNENYESVEKAFKYRTMLDIVYKVNVNDDLTKEETTELNKAVLKMMEYIGIDTSLEKKNSDKEEPLVEEEETVEEVKVPKRIVELLNELRNNTNNCDCSICKAERKLVKKITIVERAKTLSFTDEAPDYNGVTIALMGKKTLECCITEILHNSHIKEYDNGYELISSNKMLKLIKKELKYKKQNNL